MTRSRWENGSFARLHGDNAAFGATKLKPRLAAGDRKHFVGFRVMMDEVINAVAPGSSSSILASARNVTRST